MKVSGFSFIKNAIRFQYPVAQALQSILPLCDEVVVAVGSSTDGTRELVASIHPKIKIIDTEWDASLKEGGRALAAETNKAFRAVSAHADWCFYIQGDEVLHEEGYDEIQNAMQRWKDDKSIDGFLFRYRHFYGSFDYVGASSRWYRNEVRIVRNDKNIYSYRDAQGFRKGNNEKLRVKPLNAYIHHYGWVREPRVMQQKTNAFGKLWDGIAAPDDPDKVVPPFDYSKEIDALARFKGSHPAVMQPWIKDMNWQFDYDVSFNKLPLKERFKNAVEAFTGRRPFDYNNFKIVR